jgi:hypothetical protein
MTNGDNFYVQIQKIYKADQSDRFDMKFDKKSLSDLEKRDRERMKKLEILLKTKPELNGKELYMIAMIYQHGITIPEYKKAVMYAKRSMGKGYKKARWLYIAAIDRLLMHQGKKQKFGTQYIRKRGVWYLYGVNKKTTDEERKKYGLPSLQKILQELKDLNKKK